jgi:DnaK suppressor protein
MMNITQKSEIRRHLLAERERIADEWERHGGEGGHGNEWDLRDPEERATQIASRDVDRKIADDAHHLLNKVDLALQRLDDGTYGNCASCGEPIPDARLRAKPSVSLCLACQEIKDASKV